MATVNEEKEPESFPCPLCNKPMQEGRAGMWLHYLEAGCDYVAAIRQIQQFFYPLLSMDAWKDIGVHPPGRDPEKTTVGEGTLRLHVTHNGGPDPWDTVRRVLKGVQIEHPDSGCDCESCRIIIQASERQQIRKHPWQESPRQWMDESPTAAQIAALMSVADKRHKGVVAAMLDRGQSPKEPDFNWLKSNVAPVKIGDVT